MRHWKMEPLRGVGVHPTLRNAIESEKFKSSQPLRASVVDLTSVVQQTLDDIHACGHTNLRDDSRPGYRAAWDNAPRRGPAAAAAARSVSAMETFQASKAGRLATRIGDGGRAKRRVVFRDDAILLARLYLEFSSIRRWRTSCAARACVRVLHGNARHPLRQPEERSGGARGNHIAFHPRLMR